MMSGGGNKRKESSSENSGQANHFGSSHFDCDDEDNIFGKQSSGVQLIESQPYH